MHSPSVSRSQAALPVPAGALKAGPGERTMLRLLSVGTAGILLLLASWSLWGYPRPSPAVIGELALLLASLLTAGVLAMSAIRTEAWLGARLMAGGLALSSALQIGGWLQRSLDGRPHTGEVFSWTMGLLLMVFLVALGVDFFEHVRRERAELLSDVALMSILTGSAVYLLLNSGATATRSLPAFGLTAVLAGGAILVGVGWNSLLLWCPTLVHLGLVACASLLAASAILLDIARQSGWPTDRLMGPELMAATSVLALGALMVVEPRLNASGPRPPRAVRWFRPALFAISLTWACVIVVTALTSRDIRLTLGQGLVLAAVVFGAVGVRTVMNQVAMGRTARELEGALAERGEAITSLRMATEKATTAAARFGLLLDSAVDGIVELDANGTIVLANGAFCSMVRLPLRDVVGHTWADMASRSGRAQAALSGLLDSGEAILVTEVGTTYLEARSSVLPTTPPGRVLLIRDVSGSKTAEQTIRTLLQFLQDRDEDRTRLLKRTNAAIEAERNRIARDLHDGPIQGISATSLSLEAVKLMMESTQSAEALETLKKVCVELSEEAMNLRRIMSDLRPPVLEERGLIPAVREMCDRWEGELGIPVSIRADPSSEVPSDVETLAYRVVQEALSNVAKHAAATEVAVRIEARSGTLQVEVRDDGRGFDPENAREFLRVGKVGLASMRERAELAGGTLTIRSGPGSGTVVMAVLPFEASLKGMSAAQLG
jgi:PAS domain S-box-containing protein